MCNFVRCQPGMINWIEEMSLNNKSLSTDSVVPTMLIITDECNWPP